ncbi:MAG TPA: Uma2 family endonuclease [Chloroflexota bacterium]|nr:Uma2 family endonuclease [Chloroflexota bacterium]
MIETRATTLNKDDCAFLLACADDTEESPWMVASDPHLLALHGFTVPFFLYVEEQRPDLYASSELAVRYPKPDGGMGTVGPDALAAYAPRRVRNSFDVAQEGAFPAFVLEMVSPESTRRDKQDKARLYGLLGAMEYAIFDPLGADRRQLWGFHHTERAAWARWPSEADGALRSEVLGLSLEAVGSLLRLRDGNGVLLPTAAEMKAGWTRAERAQEAAERARAAAEARIAVLEAELRHLREGR